MTSNKAKKMNSDLAVQQTFKKQKTHWLISSKTVAIVLRLKVQSFKILRLTIRWIISSLMGLDLNKGSRVKNYNLEFLHPNVKLFQNSETKSIHLHLKMIRQLKIHRTKNLKSTGMDKSLQLQVCVKMSFRVTR